MSGAIQDEAAPSTPPIATKQLGKRQRRGTTVFDSVQARDKIAIAKIAAPRAVLKVIDQAIQVHGGGGVSDDFPLARLWSGARTLRLADGPDDVHLLSIAKLELARLAAAAPSSKL